MTRLLAASMLLLAWSAPAAWAADPVVVIQETRTPGTSNKKKPGVQHMAVVKNTGPRPVRVLRVTVEFYDYFGKLLWVRSAVPVPARIEPGETATLSLSTPSLEAARRTRYRIDWREGRP
jgi:hypothetical protein